MASEKLSIQTSIQFVIAHREFHRDAPFYFVCRYFRRATLAIAVLMVKYMDNVVSILYKYCLTGRAEWNCGIFVTSLHRRAGTFTLAAERLGIQQPPLSQQIKMLEGELGFCVVPADSERRRVVRGGKVFLDEARNILAGVERAGQRASSAAHGKTGKLALGFTTSSIAHWLAPRLISGFREAYPDVEIEFQEGQRAKLIQSVANGSLDVGTVRTPVLRPAGVSFNVLLKESMLLAVSARHPIARAAVARARENPSRFR